MLLSGNLKAQNTLSNYACLPPPSFRKKEKENTSSNFRRPKAT
jgi:hypothetical protein